MMAVLMFNLFIIYISNNSIKNVIVTLSALGILFSIVTNFNHAIDEKKHFMSAFNMSFGNFDFEKNPITDKQIETLPQLSKFTTIDAFLKTRYIPEITHDVNLEDVPSTPANYSAILYIPSAIGMALARVMGGSIIDMYILGRIFNLIAYGVLICIALINKVNKSYLKFFCYNNKLKFRNGIFSTYSLVQCDKVAIVHTNKSNENLEIIIITSIRSKNKKLKLISKDFINKNKEVADEYIRIKKIRNDAAYYFQVINCGELNKYILLDNIYKNCVNAIYTSSAIESIKIARGQKEI